LETRTTLKKSGFTLIEVTVALTAFLIFIGIILRSFINLVGLQIEANRYRKVYSELNEIMATITTDMRDYTIDYSCFKTTLCADRRTVAFYGNAGLSRNLLKISDDNQFLYAKQTRSSLREEFGVPQFLPLKSTNSTFVNIDLQVFPEFSPYDEELPADSLVLAQPILSIRTTVKSKNYPKREPLYFQTAITTRQYNLKSY